LNNRMNFPYNRVFYPNQFTFYIKISKIGGDNGKNDYSSLSHFYVKIYNVLGEQIMEYKNVINEVTWNGLDRYGEKSNSGVYFVVISINDNSSNIHQYRKKIILLR